MGHKLAAPHNTNRGISSPLPHKVVPSFPLLPLLVLSSLASLFTSSSPLPTKEGSVHLLLDISDTLKRRGPLLGRGVSTTVNSRGGSWICRHIQRCKASRTRHSSRNVMYQIPPATLSQPTKAGPPPSPEPLPLNHQHQRAI